MENNIRVNKIMFPEYSGIRCMMMPFIQGDSTSLPEQYRSYSDIVDSNYLEKGEIGWLTIDESYVEAGRSQRGYNGTGIDRNVHIEVGIQEGVFCWGGSGTGTWGRGHRVTLERSTEVLIANSISDTCRVWSNYEFRVTPDGDLGMYIKDYPQETGILMKEAEMARISIFTPHECIPQKQSGNRQFIRIVGKGVKGREEHFTINPLVTI